MDGIVVPASIRGALLSDDLTRFDGREGKSSFLAPDPMKVLPRLPLADPADLRDLYLRKYSEVP
jgi:hypothetical protein